MSRPVRRPFGMPMFLLRLIFTGQLKAKPCSHLAEAKVLDTDIYVCPDCVALGDTWPHLRMCLICGYVGCCDQAKNRHSRKHYEATGHPLIRSIEPSDDWVWCYVDEAILSMKSVRAGAGQM